MGDATVRVAIVAGLAASVLLSATAVTARSARRQSGSTTPVKSTFPAVYRGTFDQLDETVGANALAKVHKTIKIHGAIDWVADSPTGTGDDVLPLPDRFGPRMPKLGNGPQKGYRVKTAVLRVEYNNVATNNIAGQCKSNNRPEQFTQDELPPTAFDDFLLVVTSGGEYYLNLAMPEKILKVTDHMSCQAPGLPSRKDSDVIDDIIIRMRKERDRMVYGVNGAAREARGPETISGSWSFTAAEK